MIQVDPNIRVQSTSFVLVNENPGTSQPEIERVFVLFMLYLSNENLHLVGENVSYQFYFRRLV